MLKIASPGRVNLIGEHTDYSLGYVMPMAINLYTFLEGNKSSFVEIYSETLKSKTSFNLQSLERSNDWSDYIRGIFWILLKNNYNPKGIRGKIYGNLPIGSGLSSSASLELAVLEFLNLEYKLKLSKMDEAILAKEVENEFVGVPCGVMDQMAVALGKRGYAIFIDTENLHYECVPFPKLHILIFDTGVRRELANSEYAKRREIVEKTLNGLGNKSSKYVGPESLSKLQELQRRFLGYIIRENQRVVEARDALKDGNLQEFGNIITEAHWDLAKNYGVSSPELDFFVKNALKYGALGARLTGAGFGGSAFAIFTQDPSKIGEKILKDYKRLFSHPAKYFLVESSDGVRKCIR